MVDATSVIGPAPDRARPSLVRLRPRTRVDNEAHIDRRRRMCQGPDGHVSSAGLCQFRHALERHAPRYLDVRPPLGAPYGLTDIVE